MTVTLSSTAVTKGTWAGTSANPITLTNQQLRLADDALFGSGGIAGGLTVSVDGADLVTVTRGSVVIDGDEAVAGTGVYRAGIPASVTGTLEARHATNPRIDLVVFRQYDQSVIGSHPAVGGGAIEIIPGTPSATPVVPSRPLMAVELARITVPASGGGAATSDSSFRVNATTLGATSLPQASGTISSSHSRSNLYQRVTGYSEVYDVGAAFNPTTGFYVVPSTGLYVVSGQVTYDDASATGRRMLQVELGVAAAGSNTPVARSEHVGSTTAFVSLNVYREVQLTAGNSLALVTYQTSGSSLNARGDFCATVFSVRKV